MERFNSESTIKDVLKDKELKEFSNYFYYCFPEDILNKRIDDTSWYARDAINWFYNKTVEKNTSIHYFDKHQKSINLIQISHKRTAKFAFIISGGGFVNIDTAHEGIPISKELYDRGYDIFLFTYRLGKNAKLDNTNKDINKAISYIIKNKKELDVDANDFILIGGSAGAYVAESYCSNNRGYIKYSNPQPKCLCLLYPITDFSIKENTIKQVVIGNNPSNYLTNKYSIVNHVKGTFPPTFIVHSKDDDCVSVEQSIKLHNSLTKNGVSNELMLLETGKHGWGIGKKLEAEKWFESFIKFIK